MKRLLVVLLLALCLCLVPGIAGEETAAAQTLPDEAELAAKVEAILDYLSLGGAGDYDKIYGVYNYVCQTVEYDWEVAEIIGGTWDGVSIGLGQTAYEALCQEKAVCAGIANAVTLLLDELDVPCITVTGFLNEVGHAWNLVKLNGQWYYMDPTDDLGRSVYSAFLKGSDDLGSNYTLTSDVSGYNVASAAYGSEVPVQRESWGGYEYNKGLGDITIFAYTGTESDLVIPAVINGRKVSRVERYFLDDNDYVRTLTFSEGIEYISPLFAYGCDQMTSVSIPSTARFGNVGNDSVVTGLNGFVQSCDAMATVTVAAGNPYLCVIDNVLYNKAKTSILYYPPQSPATVIHIPDGVQAVNDEAFAYSQYLEEVVLPDSVTRIGYWAFINCTSLKKINIPYRCEFIGQYAFMGTVLTEMHIPAATGIMLPNFPRTLEKLTVAANHPKYYTVDNVLFSRDGSLVCYVAGNPSEVYTVPTGISNIEWYAFHGADNLKKVILPEGVEQIGNSAFFNCLRLEEVVLPQSLTKIEDSAFFSCYNLSSLTIPSTVTSIGTSLLANVKGTIIYGEGGSAAHKWAVENEYGFCDISVPWNLSGTYGNGIVWTLSEDGVLTLTGSGELPAISGNAWELYSRLIKKLVISEGITSIADYAVGVGAGDHPMDNLKTIVLPKSLKTIGNYAFEDCKGLEMIELPDGLVSVGECAFINCSSLSAVVIPDSVESIAFDSFYYCNDPVIYCTAGSYAEQYAINNGFYYELIKMYYFDVESAQFDTDVAAKNQPVRATVKSGADAKYLTMYTEAGGKIKTWPAAGNSVLSGTTRVWTVTTSFAGAGAREFTFKASKDGTAYGTGKSAKIQIAAADLAA